MDLQEWLKANFDEEGQKLFAPILANEKVATKLKESAMMRSDYSKKQDELKEKETKLLAQIAEQEKKNTEYYQGVIDWKKGAEKKFNDGQAESEKLRNKLAAVQSRVKTLQTTYSIEEDDVKDIFDGSTPTPTPTPTPNNAEPDPRYVTTEALQKEVDAIKNYPLIPAVIANITTQHRKLFGNDLDAEDLVNGAIKEKKTMQQYWRDKYEVGKKEDELREADIQKRIQQGREEERTKILSEMSNPAAPRSGPQPSPILDAFKPKEPPTSGAPTAVDSARGYRSAVAAWREHKYAGEKSA